MVQRELKHSHRLQQEALHTSPSKYRDAWGISLASFLKHTDGKGLIETNSKMAHKVTSTDMARNMDHLTLNTAGDHDIHTYRQFIDYHLQATSNKTT